MLPQDAYPEWDSEMDAAAAIDDLWKDLRPLLVTAYNRGFKAGADAKRAELLAVLAEETVMSNSVSGFQAEDIAEGSVGKHSRAPRGLVAEALQHLFQQIDGITTKEAEDRAVAYDPRISRKTVYNEMWRHPDLYRQYEGRWYKTTPELAAKIDAELADLGISLPQDGDEEDVI